MNTASIALSEVAWFSEILGQRLVPISSYVRLRNARFVEDREARTKMTTCDAARHVDSLFESRTPHYAVVCAKQTVGDGVVN
jgi:hypothetical protein